SSGSPSVRCTRCSPAWTRPGRPMPGLRSRKPCGASRAPTASSAPACSSSRPRPRRRTCQPGRKLACDPVHLRAIKLRGFKSFPDTVEVRLEPGVAVVVGPNGSGKSNVADALVWAAGSQAPSELRAERADDVLFGGSAGRPPADFCEVELLFDNSN